MKLSFYEQESVISFNEAEKTANVYTHKKSLLRKLEKLAQDRPEECRLVKFSHSGRAADYIIPKAWIKITPSRIASEAQKAAWRKSAEKAVSARRDTPHGENQTGVEPSEGSDTTYNP